MRSADQIVIKHIRMGLYADYTYVGVVLPDNWSDDSNDWQHYVTVQRTGGGEYDLVGDNAQMTINVYSKTSQLDATQYAQEKILPLVRSLTNEPEVFDVSIESKGDYPNVEPYRPRYQIGIQLWLSLH